MFCAHLVLAVVLATQFSRYGTKLPHGVSTGVVVLFAIFIFGFAV